MTTIPDPNNLPKHTEDGKPIIYLTFDDGPHPPYTEGVLALMTQYGGQCTFFVVGQNVRVHPQVVRMMAAAGHYVANHTYTHPSLPDLNHEQFVEEMETTRRVILETASDLFHLDGDIRLMRPPYGHMDDHTRDYAADLGYAVVLWDVDPWDWNEPGSEAIIQHVLPRVFPGAIVLLHDGGGDRSQTVEALATILPELSAQGYTFRNMFVPQ